MKGELISCRHCDYQLPDEGGLCPRCERDRDTGKFPQPANAKDCTSIDPADVCEWNQHGERLYCSADYDTLYTDGDDAEGYNRISNLITGES